MLSDAISKLKTEMESDNEHPYIKLVGDFLIRHLESNPDDAEKIIAADKTIAKGLAAMKAEAKKNQYDGMGMLTDTEGFAIVLKYFGIKGAPVTVQAPTPVLAPVVTEAAPRNKFNVKLDDFL
ncbi:hypothetical protein HPY27_01685 [Brevibacillus sp. HB1.1]|uniref:hypothetical protein n=1 Tax=Brevibacillus sp. HB1.1 TaxID=2738808 RepID=UPI001575C3CF|nr:hypothetical protein [Brevibacillus sp. HB1.1]NTU28871.1 hypothetical protein [Brevibacillus sp. HB1.1]